MKRLLLLAALMAVALWTAFAAFLVGAVDPGWLPDGLSGLSRPTSLSDFGQAFTALDGLVSSFALLLGLIAVVMQTRQSADSNVIGAFTARLQYLLAEAGRLEQQIQSLKARRGCFDRCLFDNMVGKKKRLLEEAAAVDNTLHKLLLRL
jgi:opacity protein-like surface antigen